MGVTHLLHRSSRQVFHDSEYLRHNARRQEHLSGLGLDLTERTVLEVGAGIGDHTTFFLDRGCEVLCTEPRRDNVRVLRRRFAAEPRVAVRSLNLDDALPAEGDRYDIVYCYGVLYHLARPAEALAWLCSRTRDLLLLETCVSMIDDGEPHFVAEKATSQSQAVSGTGCRPSRTWVLDQLRQNLPHAYVTATQPWHDEFPTDWTTARPLSRNGLSRAVFVGSRNALDSPAFLETVPTQQSRC